MSKEQKKPKRKGLKKSPMTTLINEIAEIAMKVVRGNGKGVHKRDKARTMILISSAGPRSKNPEDMKHIDVCIMKGDVFDLGSMLIDAARVDPSFAKILCSTVVGLRMRMEGMEEFYLAREQESKKFKSGQDLMAITQPGEC